VKKAVFPLLSLVFIVVCAVFVYISREAEPAYVNQLTVSEPSVGADDPVRPASVEASLININTASLEELMTLQGVGQVIGQRIIDYRDDSGAFMTIEELKEVSGIGEAVFERIRDRITV